jgi:hypothetical protein
MTRPIWSISLVPVLIDGWYCRKKKTSKKDGGGRKQNPPKGGQVRRSDAFWTLNRYLRLRVLSTVYVLNCVWAAIEQLFSVNTVYLIPSINQLSLLCSESAWRAEHRSFQDDEAAFVNAFEWRWCSLSRYVAYPKREKCLINTVLPPNWNREENKLFYYSEFI